MTFLEVVVHSLCANSIPTRGDRPPCFRDFRLAPERGSFPSYALSDDYQDLHLNFILSNAQEAARDFLLPKIVQAIFYAMVVNDALELDVLRRDMVELLKSALIGLRWSTFEVWLRRNKDGFLRAHSLGPVNPEVGTGPAGDQEACSGSNDVPPPPSDNDDE
ncbi:hypothetical protein Cgig2_021657 [Carnegiea gigantea]|uniref:Uncharacterized protein n=1 Tax=Carnegiea gigantea TaxID=171969 RepID=A0A9Q1KB08_9CARY|nr:hypothetical protein Cgig2_021657 [Carnegiea gigantea]